jgi:NAD(P)-dependent dehydrogenase (short-subunit alcohol dehydrogenase family)
MHEIRHASGCVVRSRIRIMKLRGKRALITGGSSGIGFPTAKLFIEEGAEVAITGQNQETLNEAVQSLGSKASGYRADVTNSDDRKKLFENLAKRFGKLDIAFANAGVAGQTVAGKTTEEEFENIIRINLNGFFSQSTVQFLCSMMAVPSS